MISLLFFCVLVIGSFHGSYAQKDGDLDSLIKEVFNKPDDTADTRNPPVNLQPNTGGAVPGTGDCICVPYYLCSNQTIITNGETLIDIR